MSLSKAERETIINFNALDKTASIFTSQPEIWRKLEKIKGFTLIKEEKLDGKVCTKEFEFPRSFVRMGEKGFIIGHSKRVSEEQKDKARRAMTALRNRPKPFKSEDNILASETSHPSNVVRDIKSQETPE